MTRSIVGLFVLALSMLASAGVVRAQELKSHMTGWERILTLEYAPGEYRGKPALEGTVTNISPYDLAGIRLLVDTLDAAGQVTGQQIAWVPGDLPGGSRRHFSVPTPPAPAYRVSVFTYDRIESVGPLR